MFRNLSRYVFLTAVLMFSSVENGECGFLDDLTPTVDVTLSHPPNLGFTVDRVAFVRSQGECSDEFISELIEDFVTNDVEVVERERLDEILEEIEFSASGYIDENDALAIGQILGPSALMFVEVHRCQARTHRSHKDSRTKQGSRRTYYSTTEMFFKGSLRIVDLATGRIFSAKTVEGTPKETASSSDGYPAYPAEYELHDRAIREAVVQVHRMFFPWNETRTLRFYKDDKCDLRTAYQLLKIGNLDGAAAQSERNLDTCKSRGDIKPKTLARAYYNVGMSHFMRNHHAQALEFFEQAYSLKAGSRIQETILECKRAQEESKKMLEYESRMELAKTDKPTPSVGPAAVMAPEAETESAGSSVADRLHQLEKLRQQGLVNDEEYQSLKQNILSDL